MPRRAALTAVLLTLTACGTARTPAAPATYDEAVVVTGDRAQAYGLDAAGGPAEADRQLVRTASLTVTVGDDEDVAAALGAARTLAETLGGYVSQEGPGWALLRVPDARLDEALDRLGALGDAGDREVYTRDVTAATTDLAIRLDNARALQARLRDLLAEAEGVQDVLAVERELARVTTEVESLEGRLRLLQNQVAFSTVRLTVRESVRPGPLGWVVVGVYEAVKWLFVWD